MKNRKKGKKKSDTRFSNYDVGSDSVHSLKENSVDFTVLHKLTEEHSKIIDNLIAELQVTSDDTSKISENSNLESKNTLENKIDITEEDEVYVILDAKNAICGAFSKDISVEKLVNDRTYSGVKANYSLKALKTRAEGIRSLYNLTKEQSQRIDSFIYTTLCAYDEAIWINKGIDSNKAEDYVKCMAKEYKKEARESNKEYIIRCQTLRKQALAKEKISVKYKLEGLWTTFNLKSIDKIMINKFSNMYDIVRNRKFIKKLFESNKLLLQEKY
jgi:hypothetical protein